MPDGLPSPSQLLQGTERRTDLDEAGLEAQIRLRIPQQRCVVIHVRARRGELLVRHIHADNRTLLADQARGQVAVPTTAAASRIHAGNNCKPSREAICEIGALWKRGRRVALLALGGRSPVDSPAEVEDAEPVDPHRQRRTAAVVLSSRRTEGNAFRGWDQHLDGRSVRPGTATDLVENLTRHRPQRLLHQHRRGG